MKACALLIVIFFTIPVHAGGYIGVGAGSINNIEVSSWPSYDSEDKVSAFKLHGGYEFTDNWSLSLAFMKWGHLNYKRVDAVSDYEVRLSHYDILLEPVFKIDPSWFLPVKISTGIVYSEVELRVKESFFGIAPAGEVTVNDNTLGFLFSLGLEVFRTRHMFGTVNFSYIVRNDFFEDSSKPFDIKTVGTSFELAFF